MSLGIDLAHVLHGHLVFRLPLFLLHPLVVVLGELDDLVEHLDVRGGDVVEGLQQQAFRPSAPVQVHEHLLLQLVLPVVDHNGVVVAVEAVDQRLDAGLVQLAHVARGLPRLLAQHHQLRVNEAEAVDHHFALHALDGIHHESHRARVQLLEALLRVDVHAGQPAAKARVTVVPSHDHLRPALHAITRRMSSFRLQVPRNPSSGHLEAAGDFTTTARYGVTRTVCFSMSSIFV
mmetsp:Transcript_3158/g.12678  ORF Transcript_3158/g.12678 Transcript_3158/m.12678 type:complete len:233 (+) Transcript_3158:326-1024(+)